MDRPKDNSAPPTIFLPATSPLNRPERIVTLGHFYPQGEREGAKTQVAESRAAYGTAPDRETSAMRENLGWTKLIQALNHKRQWPLKRLHELLDPQLAFGIALAVVPLHDSYRAFWPLRTLARQLAENARIDATSCLIRHTSIRRITFGGPSTKELHRATIRVENASLITGKSVLLLDDIVKSGASLEACREMLLEAGAKEVQALALGRVIVRS